MRPSHPQQAMIPAASRRDFLQQTSAGFGYLAFAGLAAQQQLAASDRVNPLAPKEPHFPARAKRVIFLYMRGGPSAMETFEYKPKLYEDAGKESKRKGRKLVGNNWEWKRRGESGLWVSELMEHTAGHADDLCVLSGMHTDSSNHTPATLQTHTGDFQFTRPSMGSWVLYGLGAENQDVPGFITMSPPLINGGAKNYGTAFLPAVYQGTAIGDIKTPIQRAEFRNPENPRLSRRARRSQLDLAQALNRRFARQDPQDSRIDGVIESLELGFRMQSTLPDLMDISGESQAIYDLYGIGDGKPSDNFGRQCLLARRFAESGVRFIEICDEFWDQHSKLKNGHEKRAAATDKPIAGLLSDLKQRGLLEDTLVVWGGEFGRTPDTKKKNLDGRDHNANGYTMWMAGGGVKGGFQYGATDEHGFEAVEGRMHLHDLHATILHLMGLDHEQLTYRYAGRDFRLTDVHGRVPTEILA